MSALPLTHRQIQLVFAGLGVGMLLAALDQTIVATALPTIVGEMGGLEHISWVVTAYLLASTASTPIYGKLGDLWGRKALFQAAILIFIVGSIAAALATTLLTLILARGLQGLGAGGLLTTALAIIGDVVSPRERGRYQGYIGAVFAFASVAGPVLGGFFVDHLTWRWVFWINLPLGLLALVVTAAVLHLPRRSRAHTIDWAGAAVLVAAVCCLLLVTVWGGRTYAWGSATILGLASAGVALSGLFLWWESRVPEPILPLRLFHESAFRVSAFGGFLVGVAMFGGIVFLPLYLQIVEGASATGSGLRTLPLMAGIVAASVGSGRIIAHTGRYKVFPLWGSALMAVGLVLLAWTTQTRSGLSGTLAMLCLGIGIGATMQVLILMAQNAVAATDLGTATSTATFFRSMGGAFGVALFGAILNHRLAVQLPRFLPSDTAARLGDLALHGGPQQIAALPPDVRHGLAEGFAHAFRGVFLWGLPVTLAALWIVSRLKEVPLRESVGEAAPVAQPLAE